MNLFRFLIIFISLALLIFSYQNCEQVKDDLVRVDKKNGESDNHIINIYDPDGYNAGLIRANDEDKPYTTFVNSNELCESDFARIEIEGDDAYLTVWDCEDIEPESIDHPKVIDGIAIFDDLRFEQINYPN